MSTKSLLLVYARRHRGKRFDDDRDLSIRGNPSGADQYQGVLPQGNNADRLSWLNEIGDLGVVSSTKDSVLKLIGQTTMRELSGLRVSNQAHKDTEMYPLGARRGYNVLADSTLSQIRWHQANAEANLFGDFNFIRWIVEWWNGRQMDRYIGHEYDKRFSEFKIQDMGTREKSVIDLVLQAYMTQPGKQPSSELDPDFRALANRQVRFFVFTGHDSTSSTNHHSFHVLSEHPNALDRIRAEHDQLYRRDVSKAPALRREHPELLSELSYTTAVIKETLRLSPPAASSKQGNQSACPTNDLGAACPTDDVSHSRQTPSVTKLLEPSQRRFLPERYATHDLYPTKDCGAPVLVRPQERCSIAHRYPDDGAGIILAYNGRSGSLNFSVRH